MADKGHSAALKLARQLKIYALPALSACFIVVLTDLDVGDFFLLS